MKRIERRLIICSESSPRDKKELFNLRHASLRNAVERIFGIIKRQWRILLLAPEYKMEVQARIPAALCAIHNFIQRLDPETFFTPEFQALRLEHIQEDDDGDTSGYGNLADGPVDAAERHRADGRRDQIAEAMWEDYRRELRERGLQ